MTSVPAATSANRNSRPQTTLTVLRREQLSPHMVRIIAGGPGFADYRNNAYVDRYVKIAFPQPGVDYPQPLDLWAVRETHPREQWPYTRTYTVRWVDEAAQELAIDFVIHGDEGLAGPWAASAQEGDALIFTGPGGGYNPDPEADWHLFAGDESALPAIGAALAVLPRDARGLAFLEVGSAADVLALAAPAGVELRWLFRGNNTGADDERRLADAVGSADWPEGRPSVFAHGERGAMKALREVFFTQRGLERGQVSLSGYWARGRVEDDFQAEKKLPIGKI
ncbi:siderophore-interacting protein [Arthrobacter sp. NPDC057259]|uniref:siderophore-interacting protein n=1 Tax=Arthrobacter sp. NPDC057259 TaxID=3346073 RepID=UPI003631B39D